MRTFYNKTRSAAKLIVVDLGFLGDSVHLVPALWEIKRHYPQAQLHTLSATVGANLLNLVPCVDRAWAFPLTPDSPPWWRHWDIIRALRRENFDVAFNFNGTDRSIFLTRLAGARHRIAHEAGRRHFWNRWFIPDWVPRQNRELPVFEQRRQVLAACGFSLDLPRFDLAIPPQSILWARTGVPEGAIHLSINASSETKEWPLEHWIELANLLLKLNPGTRLTATATAKPRERARLAALRAAVRDPRLTTHENLDLGHLAALLSRCSRHIGADSGVLHLAMALGIPTFTFFRLYEGVQEWVATGPQHLHLKSDSLAAIRPEHVLELLAGAAPKPLA